MYACRDGHAEIARELLDAGANMEKRDVVSKFMLFSVNFENCGHQF